MFIKIDHASFNGGWKQFVRIRVALDTEIPLKRKMKLKREDGSGKWII